MSFDCTWLGMEPYLKTIKAIASRTPCVRSPRWKYFWISLLWNIFLNWLITKKPQLRTWKSSFSDYRRSWCGGADLGGGYLHHSVISLICFCIVTFCDVLNISKMTFSACSSRFIRAKPQPSICRPLRFACWLNCELFYHHSNLQNNLQARRVSGVN